MDGLCVSVVIVISDPGEWKLSDFGKQDNMCKRVFGV